MISKVRDHISLIMLLNSQLRSIVSVILLINVSRSCCSDDSFTSTLQASQSGYAVEYGAQGGFPGSYLNQNSQAGYARFAPGNEYMSQV